MSFGGLFGSKKKTPAELVKATSSELAKLDHKEDESKTREKISENLKNMKLIFFGDTESEAKPELVEKLAQEILESPLIVELIKRMNVLEFEAKKDVAAICSFILKKGSEFPVERYFLEHDEVIKVLIHDGGDVDKATSCGTILRECIKYESLSRKILENEDLFFMLFDLMENPSFDVVAEIFATFKLLLTKHKVLVAEFLQSNYEKFFEKYNTLIQSKNFVTLKQSLKVCTFLTEFSLTFGQLLGELLLDKKNRAVMMRYINDPDNLKTSMILIRSSAKSVQFEAFHVLKIFIANPEKSKPVLDILLRNRTKLIEFLRDFLKEKDDDEQFVAEKDLLLSTLANLEEK